MSKKVVIKIKKYKINPDGIEKIKSPPEKTTRARKKRVKENVLKIDNIDIDTYLKMLEIETDVSKLGKPTKISIAVRSAIAKTTVQPNLEKLAKYFYQKITSGNMANVVGVKSDDIVAGRIKPPKKPRQSKKEIAKKEEEEKLKAILASANANGNPAGNKKVKKGRQKKFYNQVTIVVKSDIEGSFVNLKIFKSMSISMTGCQTDDDGKNAIKKLIVEMRQCPLEMGIFTSKLEMDTIDLYRFKITMYCSSYSVPFKIDRYKLYGLIPKVSKIFVSYDPNMYQGVKIGYMWNAENTLMDGLCYCEKKCRYEKGQRKSNQCKLVTIAIFQNGNIVITGANSLEQIDEAYDFINKILYDNYNKIARKSILDIGK